MNGFWTFVLISFAVAVGYSGGWRDHKQKVLKEEARRYLQEKEKGL